MTAPTKNFSAPTDAQIDPDSPVDTTLLTQTRDALVHLEEWLGKDYTAAQNHNHDGVNSALLDLGDILRNPGFESNDLNGWDSSKYDNAATIATSATALEGGYSLAITTVSAVTGGGYVDTSQFTPVAGGFNRQFSFVFKASAANIASRARVIWYNSAQSQISIDDLYTTTNTPTAAKICVRRIEAPATARYCKIRLEGGVPGTGSGTGTVYFDDVRTGEPAILGKVMTYTTPGSGQVIPMTGDAVVLVIAGGEPGVGGENPAAGANGARVVSYMTLAATDTVTVGAAANASSAGSLSSSAGSAGSTVAATPSPFVPLMSGAYGNGGPSGGGAGEPGAVMIVY